MRRPSVVRAVRRAAARTAPRLAAVLALTLAAGCVNDAEVQLRAERDALLARVAEQDRQLLDQRRTIDELNAQVAAVRAIAPEDLAVLFPAERIVIDRLSGGYDDDGQPGHDGVVVYLKPLDRRGDIVKAAGTIRIELFDLTVDPPQLVGRCEFAAADAAGLWYGDLWTQHYTIRCPWLADPPTTREVTIRAAFVDHLTQRVMTAQTAAQIDLAP
jgi:hypothetical protein